MSRVVIIGGTGHVGTYLVPGLVCAGFEVIKKPQLLNTAELQIDAAPPNGRSTHRRRSQQHPRGRYFAYIDRRMARSSTSVILSIY